MNIRTLVFGATTAFCLFLSGIPVPGADLEGFSEQGVSVAYQAEENTSQFDASIISGGVIYEGFGHTYTVVNENMDWNEAKELCESVGGHLAVVTSQAETELFKSFELSEERNYWLGARTDESGRFVWINGERWGYENWDEGEKDQEGEEDPEACCLKLSPYGISSEEGCVWIKGKETPQENEKTGFILEWESDWGDITQEIREEKGFQSVYDIPQGLWVTGIDPEGYEYTGDQVVIQGLCVYVGNKRLSADSDYTVRYYNNTDAGEAKLIITGKGNYSGSVEQSFAIVPLSLGNGGLVSENFSAPDITLIYTGKAQYKTTTISYLLGESFIELKNGKDDTLEYSDKYDYCAEGEHTVKVKGIGNYCGDAFFTEYIVSNDKKIIGSMKFSKLPALYATGEALEPELEIKDGDIVLTEGKDYVAEYAQQEYYPHRPDMPDPALSLHPYRES